MSRRLLIIILGALVLIGIAVAIIFVVNGNPDLQNQVLKIANVNTSNTNTTNVNTALANTNASVSADVVAREFVGRNFAEAFGSGSSEDNFSNWQKTKPYTTDSFGAFLDRTQAQQRQINLTGPYHSYLTKSLVVTTTKLTTTTAAMTIGTQRQETIVSDTQVYYQDLLLDLIKVGSDWKVNAASWKPR